MNPQGSETFEDNSMTCVPKDLFFEGMQLPISIYFRVGDGHYITIGRKGEKANFSDYQNFSHPNFKIFVKNAEHGRLIDYVTELTSKVMSQQNVPNSVKVRFLSGLVADSAAEIEKFGIATTHQAQKLSRLIIDFQHTIGSFNEIIGLVAELPPGEAKHSMVTCIVSLLVAEEMQMNHRTAQEKLALGALIHDIGMRFVPEAIKKKPKHTWTAEELAVYEQHPIRGAEMLRDLKDISHDVLLIVAEHHETAHGTGFPKKLRDVKVSPFGRIVAVSNQFADLVFTDEGKIYTADEAIQYMEDVLGQPFNRQAFSALKTVINKTHLNDQKFKVG